MPNWQSPLYDTDQMQTGKFYAIYTDKDNAILLIPKENQDIVNAQVELNKFEILNMKPLVQNFDTKTNDIMARVNNLENQDLRSEFLYALEIATIRKNFSNTTEIEVEYGRKEIISIQVFSLEGQTDGELIYDINTNYKLQQILSLDNNGNPIIKKIKIKSNTPITGYVLVL